MRNITFINAGAGSGKTHRLTELLADWVSANKKDSSKVMLTTFSKKAAAEIKERTQSALIQEGLFVQANDLQRAYAGTLHSIGYQFIKKYWYKLGISPELNEIGVNEQDVFFSQAIADVPDNNQLNRLSELCDAFNFQSFNGTYTEFNPLKWKEDVIDIMNKALSNNINLEDNNSRDVSTQKFESLFSPHKSKKDYENLFIKVQNFLISKSSIFTDEGVREKDLQDKILSKVEEIERLKNRISKDYTLRNILELSKKISALASLSKQKKYLEEVIPDLIEIELKPESFDIFLSSALEYTELIFTIANESLNKYREFKQQKGLVDYTDMEVHFLDLLDDEDVQKEIKETLKLVMVDEFQDSNPIQLSIFIRLSELVEKSYWVGDPKQAIYGFRGTDPVLIDQVINEFTKVNHQNLKIDLLKISWRSTPDLVNFTNEVFSKRMIDQTSDIHLANRNQLLGDEKFKPFTDWKSNIKIDPIPASETITLIPRRPTVDFTKEGENTKFWFFHNRTFDKKIKEEKNVKFDGEKYVEKFGEKIQQLLNKGKIGEIKVFDKDSKKERNLIESDVCILIRGNANVDKFATQLKTNGIEVNAEISGLEKTVEFRLLYNIVTLFVNKNSALSSTELAYLCGEHPKINDLIEKRLAFVIPLIPLKEKNKEEFYERLADWLKDAEHINFINRLRNQSKRLSVYQTIQLIINQFNVFQKLLNFNHTKVRMANVLKLKELAKDYEDYCIRMNLGISLSGYFNFLELIDEHKKQAKSVNKNAINVMTYHKAKGLEWPIVVLMDLHDNPLDNNKFYRKEFFKTKVLNTTNLDVNNPLKNRAIEFSFWPYGSNQTVNEDLKIIIDERQDYKAHRKVVSNEASRLMYVGMTRARDYLYLTTNQVGELSWLTNVLPEWNFENCLNLNQLNNTTFSSKDIFDLGIKVDFEGIKPDDKIDIDKVDNEYRTSYYFKKHLPELQNKPYILNPSSAPKIDKIKVKEVEEKLHEYLNKRTTDSTELGNTLHQLLYIKDRSYFKEAVNTSEAFDELGIDKEQFIGNTEKFNQWIKSKYNVQKEYHELSMEVEIGNQLAKGEADLVLETNDGLILIDFKSYAGDDDVTNLSCEYYSGKYSGQLDLYAHMLEKTFENKKVIKKLIYYLVKGKIIELN